MENSLSPGLFLSFYGPDLLDQGSGKEEDGGRALGLQKMETQACCLPSCLQAVTVGRLASVQETQKSCSSLGSAQINLSTRSKILAWPPWSASGAVPSPLLLLACAQDTELSCPVRVAAGAEASMGRAGRFSSGLD
jgi:hypothetical protein